MKKIYSLLASLFVTILCFGQSQRLVLFEEFTQASCPPCASTNPALNALLNANPTKIVAIKYQTSWPGYDPMNLHNASEVQSRVTYYTVSGVPNGVEDGNQYQAQPSSFTQTLINNRYAMPSPFTLSVTHTFSPDLATINVHVDLTCTQATTASMYLRLAVIEREITFCSPPGTNGESEFEGVMKKMLPNATGTILPATMNVGDTYSNDFTWTNANVYDKGTLAVVGFIQNNTTKEVYQAAYSAPQPIANDARLACNPISGVPAIQCATTINPSVTIKNNGTSNLTSANISYNVDGGASTSIPWTGNLATNATATISLGAINSVSGAHALNVSVIDPNAAADYNTFYDNASAAFTISGTIGVALPLSQDFVSAVFPPANWIRNNPDNGPTWTRVTAGNVTTGSAKIDFYNSSSGQIDELVTPGYDFAGNITSAVLDFDVAYCQYGAENDRIQFQMSTDCGLTWVDVWNKSGTQLAFGNPPTQTQWTPTTASQWHHQTVPLNTYVGNSNVFMKIKATSNYGNNGYIDNINVSVTTGVKENTLSRHVNVYPVPSNGVVTLDVNFESAQNLKVAVYNLIGEVITQFELAKTVGGLFPIDLSKVADGAYTVKISTDAETIVKSINIVK